MGLFKSLKKLVKKVVKGVKKVFKKVGEVIGKVLNSGIGKLLMVALTVVTLGTALIAGYTAFSAGMSAGSGIFGSLVAGGRAFVGSLVGLDAAGKAAGNAAGNAATNAAVSAGDTIGLSGAAGAAGDVAAQSTNIASTATSTAAETAAKAAVSKGDTIGANGSAGASGKVVKEAADTLINAGADKGFLSKAMDVVKGTGNFFKDNPGLTQVTGQMISGYAQGKAAEEMQKKEMEEKQRIDDLWADYKSGETQPSGGGAVVQPITTATPLQSGGYRRQGRDTGPVTTGMLTQAEAASIRDAGQGRVRLDQESALSELAKMG